MLALNKPVNSGAKQLDDCSTIVLECKKILSLQQQVMKLALVQAFELHEALWTPARQSSISC